MRLAWQRFMPCARCDSDVRELSCSMCVTRVVISPFSLSLSRSLYHSRLESSPNQQAINSLRLSTTQLVGQTNLIERRKEN